MKVLLATNIEELDKRIEEHPDAEVVSSIYHNENGFLLNEAIAKRPDIIVLSEDFASAAEILGLINDIRKSVVTDNQTDARIILVIKERPPRDPFIQKLWDMHIHDIAFGWEGNLPTNKILQMLVQPTRVHDAYKVLFPEQDAETEQAEETIFPDRESEETTPPVLSEITDQESPPDAPPQPSIVEIARTSTEPAKCQTIAVYSAAETGKTFVATNLAVALSKQGKSVVLIDGDIDQRAIHRFFALEETDAQYNLFFALKTKLTAKIRKYAHHYKSNDKLKVYSANPGAEVPAISVDDFTRLFNTIKSSTEYIIIDCNRNIRDVITEAALTHADKVYLVTTQDYQKVIATRMAIEDFLEDNEEVDLQKFQLIINNHINCRDITDADITRALRNIPLKHKIPLIYQEAIRSIVTGIPVIEHNPPAMFKKAIASIIHDIVSAQKPAPKRGIFNLFKI